MKSNGNGFEEMVAIQLAGRSWPGQAKLSAENLGLKDGEVPEIFYLGNKKLYPQEWRQLFSQKGAGRAGPGLRFSGPGGRRALPCPPGQLAGGSFFLTGTSICRGSLMPAASPKACRRLRMRGVTSCPRLISMVPLLV